MPLLCRADGCVHFAAEPLLRTASGLINFVALGSPDDQHVNIVWGRTLLASVAGCPRSEYEQLLGVVNRPELFPDHLRWTERHERQPRERFVVGIFCIGVNELATSDRPRAKHPGLFQSAKLVGYGVPGMTSPPGEVPGGPLDVQAAEDQCQELTLEAGTEDRKQWGSSSLSHVLIMIPIIDHVTRG
jgi:hypothetical protein